MKDSTDSAVGAKGNAAGNAAGNATGQDRGNRVMSNVTVTINARNYDLTCNDGQEEHLRGLAADIGRRVDELTRTVGQVGESRLLLMVSLLIADELSDALAEVDRLQQNPRHAPTADDAAVATSIERLARHIEGIAAKLEAA